MGIIRDRRRQYENEQLLLRAQALGLGGGGGVDAYDATKAYAGGEEVTYAGGIWRALAASTGVTPVEGTSWTQVVAPAPAAQSSWDLFLDLPLTSAIDWTFETGTWAAAAGGLTQSDTAQAPYRARYNGARISGESVVEVELTLNSDGGGAHRRGGLISAQLDAGTDGGPLIYFRGNGTHMHNLGAEADGVVAQGDTTITSVAYGAFVKLRMHTVDGTVAYYVDGVHAGTSSGMNPGGSGDSGLRSRIALYAYGANVTFRNLKAWKRGLPA